MRLAAATLLAALSAAAPLSPAAATSGGAVSRARAAPRPALPFIEDDYPKALALARARKLPLFVDAWAPW
ncbi:hypothetical protein [Anaeromyxobacter paludicola]|uniref:Uncharacterized protein n=1 Tax=Anaeromyxobacter paludicola TaxID=2918171 RepID=A0ABM7XBU2_9BACT|nr:hypothetical protein [Anaeromyxobacter paludicola]BDG09340.1 hypothetical protein AMPC_24530 [Anaeromyxobacter paludicola]